jgi:hypothetical protein
MPKYRLLFPAAYCSVKYSGSMQVHSLHLIALQAPCTSSLCILCLTHRLLPLEYTSACSPSIYFPAPPKSRNSLSTLYTTQSAESTSTPNRNPCKLQQIPCKQRKMFDKFDKLLSSFKSKSPKTPPKPTQWKTGPPKSVLAQAQMSLVSVAGMGFSSPPRKSANRPSSSDGTRSPTPVSTIPIPARTGQSSAERPNVLDDFETERQAHRARKRSGRCQAVRSAPAHTHHSLVPHSPPNPSKSLARPLEATIPTW